MNANTFGNARATTRYDAGNLAWFLIPWGILAIIAGIVALIWPGRTLVTLTIIFGAFALITGLIEIWHAFMSSALAEARWLMGIRGLATAVLGLLALFLPGLTLGAFVVLLAVYFFILGVIEVIGAFRGHFDGWLLIRGVLAIALGIIAAALPGLAVTSLAIVFGVYAIIGGFAALAAGIRLARAS